MENQFCVKVMQLSFYNKRLRDLSVMGLFSDFMVVDFLIVAEVCRWSSASNELRH